MADCSRAKAKCNIPFTRGNQALTPCPGSHKKKEGYERANTAELNGTGAFYLFMRGKPARNNNVNPDEEIQLPCVWSGLVVSQAAADIMWTDSAQTTFDGGWEAASELRRTSVMVLLLLCDTERCGVGWIRMSSSEASLGLLTGSRQQMKQIWLLWWELL